MANNLRQLIFLNNYNNYFNRIIKHNTASTFAEFRLLNPTIQYQIKDNINFNPNDGTDTDIIMNWDQDWLPDYVFVGIAEAVGTTLLSSWFIIECNRTRGGQYKITLRRDLLNDFFDSITNTNYNNVAYIEKGYLDASNPLIFNSEGMQFNQIKSKEYLLQDKTKSAWIVGYIASNSPTEDKTITGQSLGTADYTFATYPFADKLPDITESTTKTVDTTATNFKLGFSMESKIENIYLMSDNSVKISIDAKTISRNLGYARDSTAFFSTPYITYCDSNSTSNTQILANFESYYKNSTTNQTRLKNAIKTQFGFLTEEETSEFLNTNGKLIQDTQTSKIYRIQITPASKTDIDQWQVNRFFLTSTGKGLEQTSALGLEIVTALTDSATTLGYTIGTSKIGYSYSSLQYTINLVEVESAASSVVVKTNRTKLVDAPYDMFIMPYNDCEVTLSDGTTFTAKGTTSIDLANNIIRNLGSEIYDMQILPYCPRLDIVYDSGISLASLDTSAYALANHENDGATVNDSVLIWCKESSGTLNIDLSIQVENVKIENECDTYRLCSPNYNGVYEFNLAKNGGLNFFNVDFTYKPYNPYIHVNPNFGGIYGRDFNDARGLILGGDFSFPSTSDAFKNYEINNKNYQNVFDREISNLEFNRKFQRVEQIANIGASAVNAGISGKVFGGTAGAIAGATTSAAAGVYDVIAGEAMYQEGKQFKTDMYNYSLGNIKALPYGLTKASSINFNNKLWPFLEYYTCTDEEKKALEYKIKYNGMTVMKVDHLSNYFGLGEYLKCQVIRIENIPEDYHLIQQIFRELEMGVFI